MTNFVLVHGASHGSWCWGRVVPLLEAQGHNVTAVDLPGNGHDNTPLDQVTLESYAQHACQALDQQDGPSVLVGHSLGGLTVTQAAEYRPDKISTLVYLTALLMEPGKAFAPARSDSVEDRLRALSANANWDVAADASHVIFKEELAQTRFYNDCSPEDVAWAKSRLVPQPARPITTPVNLTAENFGLVPRVYIECLKDQAVLPQKQKEMYTKTPCRVISMNTGHSPFLSAPEELAGHLLSL